MSYRSSYSLYHKPFSEGAREGAEQAHVLGWFPYTWDQLWLDPLSCWPSVANKHAYTFLTETCRSMLAIFVSFGAKN